MYDHQKEQRALRKLASLADQGLHMPYREELYNVDEIYAWLGSYGYVWSSAAGMWFMQYSLFDLAQLDRKR